MFDVSFSVVGLGYPYLGLWKKRFFCRSSDFERFQPPAEVIFYLGDLQSIGLRVAQKKNFDIFLLEIFKKLLNFPKIYFGHPSTTQSLRNRFFGKKSSKKSQTHADPPCLATCVISGTVSASWSHQDSCTAARNPFQLFRLAASYLVRRRKNQDPPVHPPDKKSAPISGGRIWFLAGCFFSFFHS